MAKIPGMKKFAQIRTLSALWQHRTTLFNMFREMFRGTYRASLLTVFALIGSAIYILFPLDLIPDFIPIAGWIDDGVVFYFLLKRLLYELSRYTISRSQLKRID